MRIKILSFLILLICFIMLPISVDAATQQYALCLKDENGTFKGFSIHYDDQKNNQVEKNKITITAVREGHLPYPAGIKEEDKVRYQFTASEIATATCDEDGGVYYCPTDSSIEYAKILSNYLAEDGTFKNIKFTFNESTGKYTVTINDNFNNKILVRYVTSGMTFNGETGLNASNFRGQFLNRSNNGTYTISGLDGNSSITLEFYQKITNGDICSGSYLGYITLVTPSSYDYEVDNPAPDYPICKQVKNYMPSGMTNSDDKAAFNSVKKSYIYECYNTGKIKYGEIVDKKTITSKFESLKEMFKDYSSSDSNKNNVCDDKYVSGSKITYTKTGTYWSMVCTENYTAMGDTAKLVKAGNGFEYESNFGVTRTCTITQINRPTKKAPCSVNISPHCSWVNSSGLEGTGTNAGPNEDFDSCVASCDGGKYSQECINSCYKEVYGSDRNSSIFDNLLSYSNKQNNISFVASFNSEVFYAPNSGETCTTDHGRAGRKLYYTYNGVTSWTCFSDWCGDHGGACYFTISVTPDGCSYDPEGEYKRAIAASKAELEELKQKQKETIDVGEYEYQITDSYLKTKNNDLYVYKVNSSNDPILNVTSSQTDIGHDRKVNVSLGNSGGETVSYDSKVVSTSNIKVKLPMSYVNKVTGEVAYKTSESSNKAFTIDAKNNKFVLLDSFNSVYYYNNDNERKYYTSIWSENINVITNYKDNTIELLTLNPNYNIWVESKNVGGGKFSSDIDCYYGLYNNYYKDCDTSNCSPDDPGGIQYIYRPIDLENMFPNRKARFNWTGTVKNNEVTGAAIKQSDSIYDDSVDPESLITEIESKGNTIYDVSRDSSEIDYEFVLTTENIRNIRKYNKNVRDYNGDNENNYLDYNMSCYTNNKGYEVCSSRFLDNIDGNSGSESSSNFITYSVSGFGIDSRRTIIGCNNAIGGTSCDNIGN